MISQFASNIIISNRKHHQFWNAYSCKGLDSEPRNYQFVPAVFTWTHSNVPPALISIWCTVSQWPVVKEVLMEGKSVLLCYHRSAACAWQGLRGAAAMEAQLHSLEVWITVTVLHYDTPGLKFSVHRDIWVPNRSMKSVALCKVFVNLEGLKSLDWNWVLFV